MAAIRAGEADPMIFGHWRPHEPLVGVCFVVAGVRLDVAALNKVETLLWDIWGAGAGSDAELTEPTRNLYDQVSQLTGRDDVPFDAVRALFTQDDRLRTPHTVTSLAPFNGPSLVTLRS